MLIKSLLHGSFSLMIFGWSQILMDLQPLFAMITNEGKLHGFSHTFLGASFIAVIAVLTGKHLSEFGLRITGYSNDNKPIKIFWFVAFLSAFIGTYSHVVLDAIMHSDVEPYYPFSMTNNFISILSGRTENIRILDEVREEFPTPEEWIPHFIERIAA